MVQLSHPYITTEKLYLDYMDLCWWSNASAFSYVSRLVIAFLPRSKHFLISWLQTPSVMILEPHKIKSVTVSIVSPSICHELMGPDAMILVFWMLNFKPTFSVSCIADCLLHCRWILYQLSQQTLYITYTSANYVKCQAGWSTSWNQNCRETYK